MAQKPVASKSVIEEIFLGDEVTMHDTKRGIVRFIGPMEDKNVPTFYGVELKSGVGKNDGTSNGQKFFHCGPNKGVFTTKMKISKTKATAESKQFPHITAGSHVNVTSKKAHGVVRYIGNVSFDEGQWIGVELDEPNGEHNGTVQERSYFKCNDKHGVFVRSDAIEILEEKKKPTTAASTATKTTASATKRPSATTSTAHASTTSTAANAKKSPAAKSAAAPSSATKSPAKAKTGTAARPSGTTTTAATGAGADKTKVGTKVASKTAPASKTAATTSAKKLPEKKPPSTKPASTANKTKVAKEATESHEKSEHVTETHDEKTHSVHEDVKVGDKVVIKPDRIGQVKYVGEANNLGPGIWFGIRLVEQNGECDGEFRGHEFFQCPQGFGVYVQDYAIVRKLATEEGSHFDFMEEEKTIEELKNARLQEIKKEREKLQTVISKFKELDTDGNQVLDRQEFSKLATGVMQCDPRAARELFATVDRNGSGHISLAEFQAWVENIGGVDAISKPDEPEQSPPQTTETEENKSQSEPPVSETNPDVPSLETTTSEPAQAESSEVVHANPEETAATESTDAAVAENEEKASDTAEHQHEEAGASADPPAENEPQETNEEKPDHESETSHNEPENVSADGHEQQDSQKTESETQTTEEHQENAVGEEV